MHRGWSVIGIEVHVDMYGNRLDVYSPGGMADGSLIQSLDIEDVPSLRRNPTIADVFHRLDYVERQGNGLKKIRTETSYLYGYTEEFVPEFRSTPSTFHVVLKNLNRNLHGETAQVITQDTVQDERANKILGGCAVPKTLDEIQMYLGMANREHFRKNILRPLLETGKLVMTMPDKPNSRNQKYVAAEASES
jgi:ATP-dependent DNA helicase RecG